MRPIRLPDECRQQHTEPFEVDGVWYPANSCARCAKRFPPYMVGVPTEAASDYCWGHEIEDAVSRWRAVADQLAEALREYGNAEPLPLTWSEAQRQALLRRQRRIVEQADRALAFYDSEARRP